MRRSLVLPQMKDVCNQAARKSGSLPGLGAAGSVNHELLDLPTGFHRSHQPARALAASRPGFRGLWVAIFRQHARIFAARLPSELLDFARSIDDVHPTIEHRET